MANDTVITVTGNLTRDVDLKFLPSGVACATFAVASTPRAFDKQANAWKDGEPLFLNCTAWRELAENCAESLTKGARVVVTGRLTQRSYETKEGERRTVFEVQADEVAPSLKYAVATVKKMSRSGGNGGQQSTRQATDDPWSTAAPARSGASQSDEQPPF